MVDTTSSSTSAYTVKIGELTMNVPSYGEYPNEQDEMNGTGFGQPNPTRISWSKSNEIAKHKIPNPAWKTMKSSKQTLWNLDIDFVVLEKNNMELIQQLVDDCGPHLVDTFFKKMYMYIENLSASADAGFPDSRWNCSMKLIEVND